MRKHYPRRRYVWLARYLTKKRFVVYAPVFDPKAVMAAFTDEVKPLFPQEISTS